MGSFRLVRVIDVYETDVINERFINLNSFVTFRDMYEYLKLGRPLLGVKLCQLLNTPLIRATTIPKSAVDDAIDDTIDRLAAINLPSPLVYVFIVGGAQAVPFMKLGQVAYNWALSTFPRYARSGLSSIPTDARMPVASYSMRAAPGFA